MKGQIRKGMPAILAGLGVMLLLALAACGGAAPGQGEPAVTAAAEREGGEESGQQFALTDTYDRVRAGARLTLTYDPAANAFAGTVANTTNATLPRVRVEVHLSNGIELGPTEPVDLAPGQSIAVNLPATDQPFATWNAHPEVGGNAAGSGEHSGGGESGSGEHSGGSESREHGGRGSGEHSSGRESGEHR